MTAQVTTPEPQPRDHSDLPEHRIAMALFTSVRAVDERDGAGIVRKAIVDALKAASVHQPGTRTVTVMAQLRDGEIPVEVHDVQDVGIAGGNGYLWIRPTAKAYREVS